MTTIRISGIRTVNVKNLFQRQQHNFRNVDKKVYIHAIIRNVSKKIMFSGNKGAAKKRNFRDKNSVPEGEHFIMRMTHVSD